jgi:hypothetical protein
MGDGTYMITYVDGVVYINIDNLLKFHLDQKNCNINFNTIARQIWKH